MATMKGIRMWVRIPNREGLFSPIRQCDWDNKVGVSVGDTIRPFDEEGLYCRIVVEDPNLHLAYGHLRNYEMRLTYVYTYVYFDREDADLSDEEYCGEIIVNGPMTVGEIIKEIPASRDHLDIDCTSSCFDEKTGIAYKTCSDCPWGCKPIVL